jgi:hypothetical protein
MMTEPFSSEQLDAIRAVLIEEMTNAPELEPVRSFEDGDYVLTCRTPGCEGEGEPIPFRFVGIYDAQCGSCGEQITDVVPAS